MLSGVTAGGGRGQSALLTLLTGKFLLTNREKGGKEKRENGEEKKENRQREEREGEKLKMKGGKVTKCGTPPFFFLFCFVLFCFVVFHFSKPLKFVLGLPKWESSIRKKIRKMN